MRFGRGRRGAQGRGAEAGPGLGVGALVLVRSEPGTEQDWAGEPVGVIVAPGATEIAPYPGLGVGVRAQWTVAFDPPAYAADGRGPFERASIPARLLQPLPVGED